MRRRTDLGVGALLHRVKRERLLRACSREATVSTQRRVLRRQGHTLEHDVCAHRQRRQEARRSTLVVSLQERKFAGSDRKWWLALTQSSKLPSALEMGV